MVRLSAKSRLNNPITVGAKETSLCVTAKFAARVVFKFSFDLTTDNIGAAARLLRRREEPHMCRISVRSDAKQLMHEFESEKQEPGMMFSLINKFDADAKSTSPNSPVAMVMKT